MRRRPVRLASAWMKRVPPGAHRRLACKHRWSGCANGSRIWSMCIAWMTSRSGSRLVKRASAAHFRALFAGRMQRIKGSEVLLEALPIAAASLRRPINATFAGEGPARLAWQARARSLAASCNIVRVDFPGWLDQAALEHLEDQSDLLMVRACVPSRSAASGSKPEREDCRRQHSPWAAFRSGLSRASTAIFARPRAPRWPTRSSNACTTATTTRDCAKVRARSRAVSASIRISSN